MLEGEKRVSQIVIPYWCRILYDNRKEMLLILD